MTQFHLSAIMRKQLVQSIISIINIRLVCLTPNPMMTWASPLSQSMALIATRLMTLSSCGK